MFQRQHEKGGHILDIWQKVNQIYLKYIFCKVAKQVIEFQFRI